MKTVFRLIFFFLLLVCSCETENEDPCGGGVLCSLYCENGYVLDANGCEMCECIVLVFAGIYDDTFNYHELNPPLEIDMVWDNDNIYFEGEDYIDFDLDGNNDIKIDIGGYNEENLNKYPLIFNHCTLTPFNDWEINYYTETFYGGMGFVANFDFVSRLDFNEGIDGSTNWYSGKNTWIRMFYENPSSMPYGDWYNSNGLYYIGVRKNNKYGWIKLEMFDGRPTIISYAIQN